jgi:hypothetical protein
MDEKAIQNIPIQYYLDLLKSGENLQITNQISEWLNAKTLGITGGMDLAMFQLQKDLLLITCKQLIAYLKFDEYGQIKYSKRIEDLKKAIEKKTADKKGGEPNPYKSFVEWLLVLKKYYGSDIDRSNDLLYLVSATEQMMRFYANQEKQIENSKRK